MFDSNATSNDASAPQTSDGGVDFKRIDVAAGSLVSAFLALCRSALSPRGFKATVVLCYAVFALTCWKYIPQTPRVADAATGKCVFSAQTLESSKPFNFDGSSERAEASSSDSFESADRTRGAIEPLDGTLDAAVDWGTFLWNARKLWGAFLLMGVFPALIVKFVFREKLADYGLAFGIRSRTIRNALLLAPFVVLVGWLSGGTRAFYAVYPFNPIASVSYRWLVAHTATYFFLYYLGWEFMFRGFIQRGLSESLGPATAIWIQVVASTMLHYGHPASETFGCILGGLYWGFLAFRTKSIFAGWAQHALLGIALDWGLIFAVA